MRQYTMKMKIPILCLLGFHKIFGVGTRDGRVILRCIKCWRESDHSPLGIYQGAFIESSKKENGGEVYGSPSAVYGSPSA